MPVAPLRVIETVDGHHCMIWRDARGEWRVTDLHAHRLRDLPIGDFLDERRAVALQLRLQALARGRVALRSGLRRAWRALLNALSARQRVRAA